MTALVLYALAVFGLSYVVGHSQLTLPARRWLFATFGMRSVRRCPKCQTRLHWELHGRGEVRAGPELTKDLWRCGRCSHEFVRARRKSLVGWLVTLAECPACTAFWVGLAVSILQPNVADGVCGALPSIAEPLPFSLLSAGAAAVLGLATRLMEA